MWYCSIFSIIVHDLVYEPNSMWKLWINKHQTHTLPSTTTLLFPLLLLFARKRQYMNKLIYGSLNLFLKTYAFTYEWALQKKEKKSLRSAEQMMEFQILRLFLLLCFYKTNLLLVFIDVVYFHKQNLCHITPLKNSLMNFVHIVTSYLLDTKSAETNNHIDIKIVPFFNKPKLTEYRVWALHTWIFHKIHIYSFLFIEKRLA